FAVILPDDFILSDNESCLEQMISVYENHNSGVIAVENVPRSDTSKYGILETVPIDKRTCKIESMVEKPDPDNAPSTLAV
ncbi:UTP--glucose-1-phosphate uridylyltransferase, partial [Candidatus Saccharibacteria bacterium]|nr:UTP--glucose-1-phosphate uridylyltransferase [Candidatus Saccharibacteria bacterium]NIV65611.1 UTP--glucose-1-phosphate uridylyltransferase [Nitrosopumilaceae archaeon]